MINRNDLDDTPPPECPQIVEPLGTDFECCQNRRRRVLREQCAELRRQRRTSVSTPADLVQIGIDDHQRGGRRLLHCRQQTIPIVHRMVSIVVPARLPDALTERRVGVQNQQWAVNSFHDVSRKMERRAKVDTYCVYT